MSNYFNSYPIHLIENITKAILLQDKERLHTELNLHQEYEKSIEYEFESKQITMIVVSHLVAKEMVKNNVNEVKVQNLTNMLCNRILTQKSIYELYEYEFVVFDRLYDFYKQQFTKYNNMIVYRLLNYLQYHYLDPDKLNNVAEDFGYTINYLNRVFKDVTNNTIKQHVIGLKMERAQYLLKTSKMSMEEISHELNFYDVAHFSKMFKKFVGVSPTHFKKTQILK